MVSGDGIVDLVVGAPGYPVGGRVFVFTGSPPGFTLATIGSVGAVLPGGTGEFGSGVDGAGDVNGDGYADLITGAPSETCEWTIGNCGLAVLYLGSPAGITGVHAVLRPATLLLSAAFGLSVAGLGDVNGDGYADVAAGAPRGFSEEGYVAAYHGSSTGIATLSPPSIYLAGPDGPRGWFGYSVE